MGSRIARYRPSVIRITATVNLCFASIVLGDRMVDAPDLDFRNYFIALYGGLTIPSNSLLNDGFVGGNAYGYRYRNFRTTLQLEYLSNNYHNVVDSGYSMTDLMLNVDYSFNADGHLLPFLGAGIGYLYAWQTMCNNFPLGCTLFSTGSHFAYQGIAGLGWQMSPSFRVDLRYRYLTYTDNNHFNQNIVDVVFSYFFPSSSY